MTFIGTTWTKRNIFGFLKVHLIILLVAHALRLLLYFSSAQPVLLTQMLRWGFEVENNHQVCIGQDKCTPPHTPHTHTHHHEHNIFPIITCFCAAFDQKKLR